MMERLAKSTWILTVLVFALLWVSVPSQAAYGPQGWVKLTGAKQDYYGATDGILGDRQNSYAWSLQFHGDYLYVGTMRNVVGVVLAEYGLAQNWPKDVPVPTDMRGRIYRMKLSTGKWELFYLADAYPPNPQMPYLMGPDVGYRMMKTFTAKKSQPVLYVGGSGFGGASRLLAIDCKHSQPVPVFTATQSESIRALVEHEGKFFWASDIQGYPAIWCSYDPLGEYKKNPSVQFERIDVPAGWFPKGAEILDMVSWNGCVYVFFFDHDYDNGGFWCAKLKKSNGVWDWRLVVGDKTKGAKYAKGMGRIENGGATPFVFKNKMYVGTISNVMWRFLHGDFVDLSNIPATGTQIFRFDKSDKWERVMPPAFLTDPKQEALVNGFVNPANLYLWRFAEADGKLYAGTFDCQTALQVLGMGPDTDVELWNPHGFDLYSTVDGKIWLPEAVGGFSDPFNYGARTLLTNPKTNELYLGTANPFYGCQVWKRYPRSIRR